MISGQYVQQVRLKVEEVVGFDRYPFCLPAVRHLHTLPLHPKLTFLVGENGSGKSTLLEAIAVAFGFNPEGGTKNFGFTTRASHSDLHEYLRLVKGIKRPRDGFFLRAESFFNLATEIERLDEEPGGPRVINSYGGKSLHEQSHGAVRGRASSACIMKTPNTFRSCTTFSRIRSACWIFCFQHE